MRLPAVLAGLLVVATLTTGCVAPDAFGGSRQAIAEWAEERGFAPIALHSPSFRLTAFVSRRAGDSDALTVYIEGDGAAWLSPYQPPRDPTPRRPTALALAAADSAPRVAYLGRPCQYLDEDALTSCPSKYWVERRFAPEVIDAYDRAVTELKTALGVRRIRLVGYSGGGVIAALLAARRSDVTALVTVASPLAVADWIKWHGATPLTGSLDPMAADFRPRPGVHFVGGSDTTVPAAIVARYVGAKGGHMETVAEFDHECCWSRDWPRLLRKAHLHEETR